MTDRKYHLSFCARCAHSKFDRNLGILCGLTSKVADFDAVCPSYDFAQNKFDNEINSLKRQIYMVDNKGLLFAQRASLFENSSPLEASEEHRNVKSKKSENVYSFIILSVLFGILAISLGLEGSFLLAIKASLIFFICTSATIYLYFFKMPNLQVSKDHVKVEGQKILINDIVAIGYAETLISPFKHAIESSDIKTHPQLYITTWSEGTKFFIETDVFEDLVRVMKAVS